MSRVRTVGVRVALVAVVAFTVAGCDPWISLPIGGGAGSSATSCPAGNWTITSETLTKPLTTLIPGLTITTTGPGVTLNMNNDDTWTLHADQTLSASLDMASATLHVTADANGTYTTTGTTSTFTVAAITGSVGYDISAFGSEFTGTVTLPDSGLGILYGPSGPAKYSCNSSHLSLGFHALKMHGRHKTRK